MDQSAAADYIRSCYACFKVEPDSDVIAYLVGQLCSGVPAESLHPQIQAHAMQLVRQQQQQQSLQAQLPPREPAPSLTVPSSAAAAPASPPHATASAPSGYVDPLFKSKSREEEYVDLLFDKYLGSCKMADPALRGQLVKSLQTKSYSLNQVEWAIQMCPEAKKHTAQAKLQQQQAAASRRSQVTDYVHELCRVYCSSSAVSEEEVQKVIEDVMENKMSLQQTEDHFRLRALQGLSVPPATAPKKH